MLLELLIRVERAVARDDALTAARASSYALFRELFPNEVLAPGQLVNMALVTMLATELANADTLYQSLGDAQAFALIHEHLRLLEQQVRAEGGTLVKTLSEGMVAVFPDTTAAVRAGLRLQTILGENAITGDLQIRVGIHRGPAMAVTVNDRLDYFGTTVKQLLQLPSLVQGGETVLTHAAASDPGVDTLLHSLGLEGQILPSRLPGLPENSVQCLIPRSKGEVANKAQ